MLYIQQQQGGTSCGKRLARTDRICEDQEVSKAALRRSEAFLSPQSSDQKIRKHCIFVAEMLQKKICFKNMDIRHFSRECRKNLNICTLRTKFRIKSAGEATCAVLAIIMPSYYAQLLCPATMPSLRIPASPALIYHSTCPDVIHAKYIVLI